MSTGISVVVIVPETGTAVLVDSRDKIVQDSRPGRQDDL